MRPRSMLLELAAQVINTPCSPARGHPKPNPSPDPNPHPNQVCANGCGGHGTCVNQACVCEPGWGGADCAMAVAVPVALGTCASAAGLECAGHGRCVSGQP